MIFSLFILESAFSCFSFVDEMKTMINSLIIEEEKNNHATLLNTLDKNGFSLIPKSIFSALKTLIRTRRMVNVGGCPEANVTTMAPSLKLPVIHKLQILSKPNRQFIFRYMKVLSKFYENTQQMTKRIIIDKLSQESKIFNRRVKGVIKLVQKMRESSNLSVEPHLSALEDKSGVKMFKRHSTVQITKKGKFRPNPPSCVLFEFKSSQNSHNFTL